MKPIVLALLLAVASFSFVGCTSSTGEKDKEKIYDIKGKVISTDAEKKSIRLDHEDIPGFMAAMEMPFDVESVKLLEGLKAGDQVQGKLKVKSGKYTLIELQKR